MANVNTGLIPFVIVLGCVGCSSVVEQADGTGGQSSLPIAELSEDLSSCECSNSSYSTYELNGDVIVGPTRSSRICWPTRYDYQSSASSPNLAVTDLDGNWVIQGFGQATCVPRCCFNS